jgi:hypothetical protein
VEFENRAVAVHWLVDPTSGVEPLTAIDRRMVAMVVRVEPLTPWCAARMSTSLGTMSVTMPLDPTVATDVFDDCQVAWEVTSWVVLFESVAVAVNCAVRAAAGPDPVTDAEGTVGVGVEPGPDVVDEPRPQAAGQPRPG